jgi:hypothetical protein
MSGRLRGRLDRLERGQSPAQAFLGSRKFFAWIAGQYQPTVEEITEVETLLSGADPPDLIERELDRLIAELHLQLCCPRFFWFDRVLSLLAQLFNRG